MISVSGYAQFEHSGITIDGSVSYHELNDTTKWKSLVREADVVIRESDDSYYMAIISNTYTSVNVYVYDRPTKVKALHASYSLGDATYTKGEGGQWLVIEAVVDEESGKKVYEWKFRDPILRDASATKNIPEEMGAFYTENLWVSNTMPMGSYREMEFLISKQLVKEVDDFSLTYLKKNDQGKTGLFYFPEPIKSITGEVKFDKELQNGYLPDIPYFEFPD